MHRRIPPPFIKKPTLPIQIIKEALIPFPPPKFQIPNLKIGPKVAGGVTMGSTIVGGTVGRVGEPFDCAVGVNGIGVESEVFFCCGPEGRDRLGGVIYVYYEAVGFIV